MIYPSSWFPGAIKLGGKEVYISFLLSFLILIFSFDFYGFLNLKIKFSTLEQKVLYLIFFIGLISTLMYNSQEITTLKGIMYLLAYGIIFILYFLIIPKILYDEPDIFDKFIKIISGFGFIFSAVGLLMLAVNFSPDTEYSFAFVSIIKHPNLTSKVLTVTIFPTLFYYYWKRDNLPALIRYGYIFSISIQVVAQMLTYDRAGLIGTVIGLLVFMGFYYKSKVIYLTPLFVFLSFFAVTVFRGKGLGSSVARLYLLVPAIEMIFRNQERTLWGYGLTNGFAEYSRNLIVFYSNEPQQTDPHNTYVTLVLFWGLIFTIFVLFFVCIIIAKCIKKIFILKKDKRALSYMFLLSSLAAISIQAIFDAEIIRMDYFVVHYLFIVLGLMYISVKNKLSII